MLVKKNNHTIIPVNKLFLYTKEEKEIITYCGVFQKSNDEIKNITSNYNMELQPITCLCGRGRILCNSKEMTVNKDGEIYKKNIKYYKYVCKNCGVARCDFCDYALKEFNCCLQCKPSVNISITEVLNIKQELIDLRSKINKVDIMLKELVTKN